MAKTIPSVEQVRELLDYDPVSGVLVWRKRVCGHRNAGDIAGHLCKFNGYRLIGIKGSLHGAHRLAWLHFHGAWPADQIDHIDGNRANNAIANLRPATNAQNRQNVHRVWGASGVLGVYRTANGRFRAVITKAGKQIALGTYPTIELASEAYLVAKRRIHEHCTR